MPEAWVCYLVALHDIGKADPLFQNKDETLAARLPVELMTGDLSKSRGFRHEARSQDFLGTAENHLAGMGWGKYAISVVTQAINGHHGDFHACASSEAELVKRRALWNPLRSR